MALVPQNIKALVAYISGGHIDDIARRYNLDRVVKLSSNENPLGPSKLAIAAAQAVLSDAHHYPDPVSIELRTALAARFNLKIDNVVTGSGSEGIMATIMRTFLLAHDELISAENTFIGFKVLANASGRKVNWVPMNHYRYDLGRIADSINEYTKIVYIANPDNPTGSYVTKAELEEFMKRVPERVLVILDEAYFEFAAGKSDYPDSMDYRWDNVITLRTFSKAYGLAGLRVGYGFAHENLVANLLKVKLPFEPSTAAQKAGIAALGDEEFLRQTVELNSKGRVVLAQGIEKLGIEALPSAANFVTMVLPGAQRAAHVTEQLMRRGVVVRNLIGFGWPHLIRVTTGLVEENELFLEKLAEVLKT